MNKKTEYCDWTITIAFYSAIHYVRHLMLPCTELDVTYNTFESMFKMKKNDGEGRHGFQMRYVKNGYPDISYEYVKLHDMSNNARYIDYRYGREESKLAKSYLEKIKEYVEKYR